MYQLRGCGTFILQLYHRPLFLSALKLAELLQWNIVFFVCGLFDYIVSSSDFVTLNDAMINE